MNASSPASSGPAGSHFEAQVGAHYLLSLLIGAEPRGSNLNQTGAASDDDTVWRLLSKLQILVFDFTAPGSASEALERERAVRALHPGETTRAEALQSNLIQLAIKVASSAGERTRAQLIEDVSGWSFRLAGDRRYSIARNALAEDTGNALADIVDRVGDVTLIREDHIAAVRAALDEGRYVEIRGDAGVGKSGLLKHLAQQRSTESRIIVLSPGRTKPGGWTELRGALGFDGGARDLLVDLAAGGGAILFVDGLDFLTKEERLTVVDLVREAAEVSGFTVVATARREFAVEEPNWLPEQALDKLGRANPVTIEELSTAEIAELQDASPAFASLLADNHPARAVTRNLFRLAQLSRQPDAVQGLRTEIDMAERWWRTADGTGLDWAVANLLHSSPDTVTGLPLTRPAPGPLVRGVELAARMALERAGDDSLWRSFLEEVSREGVHGSWRRAALLALVRSEVGVDLLNRASGFLLANRATLLRELVRTVTAVAVRPASKMFAGIGIDAATIPENWNVPSEPSWHRLIRWLLDLGENLPAPAIPDVTTLYMNWSSGTLGLDKITPKLLKWFHSWLTEIETARESEDFRQRRKPFGGGTDTRTNHLPEIQPPHRFPVMVPPDPDPCRRVFAITDASSTQR